MKIKATTSDTAGKPKVKKPYPEFPLTPHPSGRWCKKVKGNLHYFGRIAGDEDGQKALDLWKHQADDIRNGRTPHAPTDDLTLKGLGDRFCTAKLLQREAGEITPRHFNELRRDFQVVVDMFGRTKPVKEFVADDFAQLRAELGKRLGAVALGNTIQRIRQVFRYGFDNGLIEHPVRYGSSFNKPSKSVVRRARAERGERLFDAVELRKIIAIARPSLKAMILLGVNCGLENSSCGKLEFRHLDLDSGWLNFPRPKTGIARRCKLWPETVKALRVCIAKRKAPIDPAHAELVFITKRGLPWGKTTMANPISHQFRFLLVELDFHRPGISFYTLRHQFETVAGGSRDQVAVNQIMGHADATMASVYRERIDDDRLVAVADHVRSWLFGTMPSPAKKTKSAGRPTRRPVARKSRRPR